MNHGIPRNWRFVTGTGALDFVLGNNGDETPHGVVQSSITVLRGAAQAGKSTLLTQVAYDLAGACEDPCRVLLASPMGRGSAGRAILARIAQAEALPPSDLLTMADLPSVSTVMLAARALDADVVIIDDVDLMPDARLPGVVDMLHALRSEGVTVLAACHCSAPPLLARAADVILDLSFDGEAPDARILRGIKNAHAPLAEAKMRMGDGGLTSVVCPLRVRASEQGGGGDDDGGPGEDEGGSGGAPVVHGRSRKVPGAGKPN